MDTYASTQSSGILMKWVVTRRHCYLIIIFSLSRSPGNFILPMDHVRCGHWLSPVLVNRKWSRRAVRDSIIESKLSKMRRSAFKMFHIVSRVANEEAQISADLTRWPFIAGAAGNFQPARKHTIVRGVPSFSIAFPFPVKAFTPLTCTGIERSVMQRSLLPIKLPEYRTATLQYGTCAREALCPHCQWNLVPSLAHWRDPLRKARKAQYI